MGASVGALVLVADDDPFNLRLLQELCENAGHRVRTASDGTLLLEMIAREQPDLVMVSATLRELDGFGVLQTLKSDPDLGSVPVILLTDEHDEEARSRGVRLGAEEFLTKPYRVLETEQRIRNALRVRQAETAAKQADERARSADRVDPVTHAGTVQQLVVSLDYEFTRAARYGHPLSCLVVRIVNLAAISKRGGEEASDGVMVAVASGLRQCIRSIDHLFRSGPSEFVCLLPETGTDGATTVVDRVHERTADHSLWGVETDPLPEVRAAVATYPHEGLDRGEALLEAALAALPR